MPYTIRDENVIWDAMSSENVIIADLKTGEYSTLTGRGSELFWSMIVNGESSEQIVNKFNKAFQNFSTENKRDLEKIIFNFKEANLIIETSNQNRCVETDITKLDLGDFNIELTRYNDMQNLLQLDPIDNMIED